MNIDKVSKKKFHLFVGDVMRYEAWHYEESFVNLDDAYQVFIQEEPCVEGYIMQNAADGSLVRTHELNAEHYWDNGKHAYKYSISPPMLDEDEHDELPTPSKPGIIMM